MELGFTFVTGEYDNGGKIFKKRDLLYLGSKSIQKWSWSSMDSSLGTDTSRSSSFFQISIWLRIGKEGKWLELESIVVKCPRCGSKRTWKDGVRYNRDGEVQR